MTGRRALAALACVGLLGCPLTVIAADAPVLTADAQSTEELSHLSLAQLANVEVTSVAKAPQPLSQAPAAIYVITHDEILRSGATSLPEALELAPNLTVTRLSASDYTVAARGLGGNPGDQNFSNKLLMLIDGRSVYTPLYSGIYMDAQSVPLQDIDRIEVISGPGATLWGANAMNGVINIITRSAQQTAGELVDAGAGNQQQQLTAQLGRRVNDALAWRVYGLSFHEASEQLASGQSAQDAWDKVQGGFRLDYQHRDDAVTFQGDVYRAPEETFDAPDGVVSGGNLLGHWQRQFGPQSVLQVLGYIDQTERFGAAGNGAFVLHTYDLEAQDSLPIGARQQLIVGGGERLNDYAITSTRTLLFVPEARNLTLGDVFAHDTVRLTDSVQLIAGLKLEDDPYQGWAVLPDVRASWNASARTMLWAAVSRANRSPTPFDVDVQEKAVPGGPVILSGNPAFLPEWLTAWQLGYRTRPISALSFSLSAFYNDYTDLRTVEFSPGPGVFEWGNRMRGITEGVEAWAEWQVTNWWRLGPGLRDVHERFRFEPDSSGLLGTAQAGNDPSYQAEFKSSMDLPHALSLDASLRYVSALPSPALPGYYALMARLAWQATPALQLSVAGQNLLQSRVLEYPSPNGEYIARSVLLEARYQR